MSYPDDGRTSDELMITADTSMYRSKRAGKNRVTGVSIDDEGVGEPVFGRIDDPPGPPMPIPPNEPSMVPAAPAPFGASTGDVAAGAPSDDDAPAAATTRPPEPARPRTIRTSRSRKRADDSV